MKTSIIKTNRGDEFELTEGEEKYYRALKRLEKMDHGRIILFGGGHSLSLRFNGSWNNDEFDSINVPNEGGDGGDNY